jgi:hypothetical protein
MNKMILYKEWLKTRWVLLGIVLVVVAITFYCFLNLTKVVQIRGAEILWETLVTKETVLTEIFRFVPAIVGAILALSQWIPEIQHKRLKLTLHLPYPQRRMILLMACFGLFLLTVLYALQACVSALIFARWIPVELVSRVFHTMLVWYLAGWAAYLFTSALCLEPTWRFRVLMLLVSAGLLRILYLSGTPEAYNSFLPWLLLYVLLSGGLLFSSETRFKEGLQD